MFMASCYWPPAPLDAPLSMPWSDNITTFGEALLSRLPNLPADMVPATIPIADRCWCDFSGGLFEPFNTTLWELKSVEKLAEELGQKIAVGRNVTEGSESFEAGSTTSSPSAPTESPISTKWSDMFDAVWPFSTMPQSNSSASDLSPEQAIGTQTSPEDKRSRISTPSQNAESLLRREYDLRPYGFDMVVDLGWSR
ncbi:hypothetical protein PHLCEN_2v1018 [Hermanssonia centrifuga]|uniref:Uncharacterized protein n=1 Tax=Hermanssonia centrifuga TaxID=98765 RepID=A0A2R6S4G7_9APHY|nr:hypothetical protein PHLCEN_2v1018 [Hermanssonia centrifuga]